MIMLEKTDRAGLYRDTKSGAIVNRDRAGLTAYKRKKEQAEAVKNLQEEVTEIKGMLNQILTALNSQSDK